MTQALYLLLECSSFMFSQGLGRQILPSVDLMPCTHHVSCRLAEPLSMGDKTVHI